MAQRIARRTSNPKVAGSNPAGGGFLTTLATVTVVVWARVLYETVL